MTGERSPTRMGCEALLAHLSAHGVGYQRRDHCAVFTCDEADRHVQGLPGARTKNLFLRDRKGRRHFLLVIRPDQTIDLAALGERLGARGIGFASERRLERHLGVAAGAVSMLALLNDRSNAVEPIVDARLWASESFQCHPMVNTVTLVIRRDDLQALLERRGHRVRAMTLPERVPADATRAPDSS